MSASCKAAGPKRRGLLVVLSAPSGAGKRTLRQALLKCEAGIRFCPSVTTRPPRAGESNGVDYTFVTRQEFDLLVERDELVEWALVFGHRYGTPERPLEELMAAGTDVLLEKDVQGAVALRKRYPDGVFVFVLPPSLDELKRRILDRGTESQQDICLRLSRVKAEVEYAGRYDYIIVNDQLDRAAAELRAIVWAERARVFRQRDLLGAYLDTGEVGVK
ncbi:MAG: guanylate kinase [Bacillota bacterium]